jgi:hypothetical protein
MRHPDTPGARSQKRAHHAPGKTMVFRAAVLARVAPACATLAPASTAPSDLEHARRLLVDAILFDGHNDLPWAIRTDKKAPGDIVAYDLRKPTP